jgi:hypothetical protein
MEAEVGIGRFMPNFQTKTAFFQKGFQVNSALFSLTRFKPLTEGFTEGF